MPRTINESIQELEKSRDAIKASLNAKLSSESGGGVEEPLKISQVAGYIDQIESGISNPIRFEGVQTSGNYLQWASDGMWLETVSTGFSSEDFEIHVYGKAERPNCGEYGIGLDWGNFRIFPNNEGEVTLSNYTYNTGDEYDTLKFHLETTNSDYFSKLDTYWIIATIMYYANGQWWSVPIVTLREN